MDPDGKQMIEVKYKISIVLTIDEHTQIQVSS